MYSTIDPTQSDQESQVIILDISYVVIKWSSIIHYNNIMKVFLANHAERVQS